MEDKTPNPIDILVGARVRLRRRHLGVSQETLAEALGLTFQQVQKYERGANRVSASKLAAIAECLETPIAFFFQGVDKYSGVDVPGASIEIEEAVLFVPAVALIRDLSRPQQLALNALIRSMVDPRQAVDAGLKTPDEVKSELYADEDLGTGHSTGSLEAQGAH